jgi:hypothetical protein
MDKFHALVLLPVHEYEKEMKINPCPFCGCDALVEREMIDIEDKVNHQLPVYYVECDSCYARGPLVEAGADVNIKTYRADSRNRTSAQAVWKCIILWNKQEEVRV